MTFFQDSVDETKLSEFRAGRDTGLASTTKDHGHKDRQSRVEKSSVTIFSRSKFLL